jgi:hypothetical protein
MIRFYPKGGPAMLKQLRRIFEMTDKWQFRCPTCGKTKSMAEVGGKRVATTWSIKRTLGRCSQCGGLKLLILEPQPETSRSGSQT